MENVSGKYDPETRGFCIRIDVGPRMFQLVQGEMVSNFGIVMLRDFSNGVELPTEFCILTKENEQGPAPDSDDDAESVGSDGSDKGWYNNAEWHKAPADDQNADPDSHSEENGVDSPTLMAEAPETTGEQKPAEDQAECKLQDAEIRTALS